MDNIYIEATERSPEIDFCFSEGTFSLKGESYPEDISETYEEAMGKLRDYLESQLEREITFNFELIYFNSSSAKIIMTLFDMLDEAAESRQVTLNWYYREDDDNMEEMGEEFGEDLEHATFNLVVKDG
ncbi:DUF1987 domain-containing protein [Ectothiorhodospiraceae bacterium BW-2]|nr:DUF1987 domain-containing protein [Ectothiorhodospiraceae bacterium BW-2]